MAKKAIKQGVKNIVAGGSDMEFKCPLKEYPTKKLENPGVSRLSGLVNTRKIPSILVRNIQERYKFLNQVNSLF